MLEAFRLSSGRYVIRETRVFRLLWWRRDRARVETDVDGALEVVESLLYELKDDPALTAEQLTLLGRAYEAVDRVLEDRPGEG